MGVKNGYPKDVSREFCWKHKVWRAFDGVKIVAYNHDKDDLEKICPNGETIRKSDTKLPGHRSGSISDGCRLHYGQPVRSERGTDDA
jgi:hypothetical protein